MSIEAEPENIYPNIPKRFRFHPLVRYSMIILALIAASYSIYFIFVLIPKYQNATLFFKITSVVVLYVSLNALYKHLTSLNSVLIRDDNLELGFILKKRIIIPWTNLTRMEIYKVITHFWKLAYIDEKGAQKIFKTSLSFPGIMEILISIQDKKPDVELNELLKQVLLYKRSKQ